jgi:hypothetical protein
MSNSNETLYPLVINSSNLVQNGNNNTYRYQFPSGSVKFDNSKVAVASVSMYYSWYNITAANGNNSFQIIWPIGAGTSTFTITLPNGFYAITDLNSYLQQFCITNGLYLINSSGQYVYYCEFITNSNYYSVQFNAYSIPTALPVGWTQPSNWVGYPTTAYTPQLIVPSTNFRNIIGFNAATLPAVQQITTYSKLSDFTPQVTPTQSVILTCSLLNNQYSNPRTVLYSFSPAGTTFGSIIQSNPNQYSFIDVQDGNYSDFQISFLDQSFNPLLLNDTNLVIMLLIKQGSNNSISY